MFNVSNRCNTCGCKFDIDPDCALSTLKNQRFCATLDNEGKVIHECCELCQKDLDDVLEEEEPAW